MKPTRMYLVSLVGAVLVVLGLLSQQQSGPGDWIARAEPAPARGESREVVSDDSDEADDDETDDDETDDDETDDDETDDDEADDDEADDDEADGEGTDWDLLFFADDDRRIIKVRLRMLTYMFAPEPTTTVDLSSTDDLLIRRVQRALYYPKGPKMGKKRSGGVAGVSAIGRLDITTNRDTFSIYFYGDFRLEAERESSRASFVSWTLAKVIDDWLRDEGKRELGASRVKALSGELALDREKALYANEDLAKYAYWDQD